MPELFQAEFLPSSRWGEADKRLARRCLRLCDYHEGLIDEDFSPSSSDGGPLVAYAHRPFDARSSCIVLLPPDSDPHQFFTAEQRLAAPLIFVTGSREWQMWRSSPDGIWQMPSILTGNLEHFFEAQRGKLSPQSIFRAKAWSRADAEQQLDFVDVGLLPFAEYEAGRSLVSLFENMVRSAMNSLGWKVVPELASDARWLMQSCFWLLAAKLLHDKAVPSFVRLDLEDIETVFARVGKHYSAGYSVPTLGRIQTLSKVASVAKQFSSLKTLSIETLGALYEEGLVSRTTRKLLGTHRTPTYLVDYMFAKVSGWIEDLGHDACKFYEPACGHAPFLVAAVRKLSNMLPPETSYDSKLRRQFLRQHIRGNDQDPFALEIARLSLTLADIPNGNGWILQPGDMFDADHLAENVNWASVVLANPPFENEQAATFLRRTIEALQPGAIFGVVMPSNVLTGVHHEKLRRLLLKDCELREISIFPDKMFRFASVESGIILGRKHKHEPLSASSAIRFRRVRERQMESFRRKYLASWDGFVTSDALAAAPNAKLLLPELEEVWRACDGLPKLNSIAQVTKGFDFRSTSDPLFPRGQITHSIGKKRGFVQGFRNLNGSPLTHLNPQLTWLNMNPAIINARRGGTIRNKPQVLQAYSPTDRDPWRHKAFIDEIGRPVTSRFLIIRPKAEHVTLKCLWAICNSPLANAYTYARTSKRDITIGEMSQLFVPEINGENCKRLEAAVDAYLTAASQVKPAERDGENGFDDEQLDRISGQIALFAASDVPRSLPLTTEQLRALQWRVDAEVLRLYDLPRKVERSLLNFFNGVARCGVPFEQNQYIPTSFEDVETLDQYLQITAEWGSTEARRCELIEARKKRGARTPAEEKEFREHQNLLKLRRRLYSPLPTAELQSFREVLH